MPVRIVEEAKLFSAEVTNNEGALLWRSPHPMRVTELVQALEDAQCPPLDISVALRDAGLPRSWGQYADELQPQVEAALDGRREVPPQDPFAEPWVAYAVLWKQTPSLLEDVVAAADAINHAIPTADELAWAFLRMKKRGWLSIKEGHYTLSGEARKTIQGVVAEGSLYEQLQRLESWTLAHPPGTSSP